MPPREGKWRSVEPNPVHTRGGGVSGKIVVEKRRACDRMGVYGDVAQMGERCVRNAQVEGSNPFISTS